MTYAASLEEAYAMAKVRKGSQARLMINSKRRFAGCSLKNCRRQKADER